MYLWAVSLSIPDVVYHCCWSHVQLLKMSDVEIIATMAPDPARVFYIASTIFDALFLLVFPARLWKLHHSGIKNSPEWLGPFKAVSIRRFV